MGVYLARYIGIQYVSNPCMLLKTLFHLTDCMLDNEIRGYDVYSTINRECKRQNGNPNGP